MNKMNKNTIYFYATLGDMSKPAFGGGEVGNRRTLHLLKQIGYNVVPIPKYERRDGHSFKDLISKIGDATANLWLYVKTLRKGNPKKSVVHIAGFSGSMVYWTLLLIKISKWLGFKTVYELRGGGIIEHYRSNSNLYRWCFEQAINNVDCVFSQGEANRQLIEEIKPHTDFYYYPNYVEEGFMPIDLPNKPKDTINLIYFGRLSHFKNIELIVDIFNEARSSTDAIMTLTIIGNPESEDYFSKIKDKVSHSPYTSSITLKTRCEHDVLKRYLNDMHFYIFPTQEGGEGHSNALTEAMAWGIVPIATTQGFNKDVIDCDDLIVNNLTKEAFSEIINKTLKENTFDGLSKKMYNRARNLYSYNAAYNRLYQKYSDLFMSLQ